MVQSTCSRLSRKHTSNYSRRVPGCQCGCIAVGLYPEQDVSACLSKGELQYVQLSLDQGSTPQNLQTLHAHPQRTYIPVTATQCLRLRFRNFRNSFICKSGGISVNIQERTNSQCTPRANVPFSCLFDGQNLNDTKGLGGSSSSKLTPRTFCRVLNDSGDFFIREFSMRVSGQATK